MISLRDRARREGGNAVINIKSNYKNNLTSSDDAFQCGAGELTAGVALIGTVAKIKNRIGYALFQFVGRNALWLLRPSGLEKPQVNTLKI
jgi:hypothetical protein